MNDSALHTLEAELDSLTHDYKMRPTEELWEEILRLRSEIESITGLDWKTWSSMNR
jgi:hypothetical protein